MLWEGIVSFICLCEQIASIYMKEKGIISLGKNPKVVLALKIIQRGTEFVMMMLLAYLVCLKTASRNFALNYRFPTLTVPLLCRGSGCCASEPDDPLAEEKIREGSGHVLGDGLGFSRMRNENPPTSPSPDEDIERRASIEKKMKIKKADKKEQLTTLQKMKRHSKVKRTFDKPIAKRRTEKRGDVEMGDGGDKSRSSEFSGFNPMAKNVERWKKGGEG